MSDGIYEKIEDRGDTSMPLYAMPAEVKEEVKELNSLSELVDKDNAGPTLGQLSKPEEEQLSSDVSNAYVSPKATPSEDDKVKLMEQAQAQADAPTSLPSEDQRKQLLENAKAQALHYQPQSSGPSEEQKRLLLEQAMKGAQKPVSSQNRIADEDRQKLLQQALQSHGNAPTLPGQTQAKSLKDVSSEQEAYFDQLAREAQAARDEEMRVAQLDEAVEDEPQDKKKKKKKSKKEEKQFRPPMGTPRAPSPTHSHHSAHKPSDEDRKRLLEQAMQGSHAPTHGSHGRHIPTQDQRAQLAAMAQRKSTLPPKSRAPTAEEREALAARLMQDMS